MCESTLRITESKVEFPEYQVINIQRNMNMEKLLTPVSLPKSVRVQHDNFLHQVFFCCSVIVMSWSEKKLNYRLLAVIV